MPAKDGKLPHVEIDENEIDFSDIYSKFQVPEPGGFDCVIVVDGAPIVGTDKEQKLIEKITALFKNIGGLKDLTMPKDENSQSKGYMFIEFETPAQAKMAIAAVDGYKFGKNHTLSANAFDDIENYANVTQEYVPPVIEPFVEKPHLRSWLKDEAARDQWVVMTGDQTGIYWNNKGEMPDVVHKVKDWSDGYVAWSPRGSYMTTFHKQGIALFGGPEFAKIVKFAHRNVKLHDFSPDEKFLVTWSNDPILMPNGEHHHVIVWDVMSGKQLRSFPVPASAVKAPDAKERGPAAVVKIDWPMFKWSHDSKYFARMTTGAEGAISIYEAPSMGLLDKKSIKIEHLKDFEWSPVENMLCYWTPEPEVGNIPARVTILKVPSREIVRTKNLFSVVNVNFHWQSNGKYLLARVEKATTKIIRSHNLEIFRLKEKDVPVDVVELKANENLTNAFWEPNGERFALITLEGSTKINVHFYEMNSPGIGVQSGGGKKKDATAAAVSANVGGAKLLKSLDRKGINQVIWSPKGRIAVLAGVRAFQGDIEFWDTDDMTMLAAGEHYTCTDIEWDPTGRYLVSSVSWWRVQQDPGFVLWNSVGVQLTKQSVPMFKQFSWRPRPPTPLTLEEQKTVKKTFKELSKEFDEVDAKESSKIDKAIVDKRKKLWTEWITYRRRCFEDWSRETELRNEIVGYDREEESRQAVKEIEEFVDEVIEETEEIIGDAADDD